MLLFLAVALAFALITQWTAKLFRRFSPLKAYSLDIGGSCVGILCFMGISWLQLPAWSWFLFLMPLWLLAMPPSSKRLRSLAVAFLLLIGLIVWNQDQPLVNGPEVREEVEVVWSPYQRVEFSRTSTQRQPCNCIKQCQGPAAD